MQKLDGYGGFLLEMDWLMRRLVPDIPIPIKIVNSAIICRAVERLKDFIFNKNDPSLYKLSNPWIYRWYEHRGCFPVSESILRELLWICRTEGDRPNEGIVLNNLAFECQLQGRLSEAIHLYRESANVFIRERFSFQHANSMANYWLCCFEADEIKQEDLSPLEHEAKKMAMTIGHVGTWIERKPMILRARIEELRGNIANAIELAEAAIESSRYSGTRYPEIDRVYLEQLKVKQLLKCG